MTSALFVSHTAEKGGAEMFMADLFAQSPPDWSAAFFQDGPVAQEIGAYGRKVLIVDAAGAVLSVRRGSSALKVLGAGVGVLRAAAELARKGRPAEVIVANSQKALFICALASVRNRRPLIWILHDLMDDDSFSRPTRMAAIYFANRFASRVVANSQATADAFTACGGRPHLVRICYNGFDADARPERSQARADAVRAEFGFDDRPIVGLFGRLVPWKGQHVLLEALRSCPDVQAMIVGSPIHGDASYEEHLRRLCAEYGIDDRVRFTGFRDDVAELMAGVDLVAHTSTKPEPFGRVIVEAMLARVPVVAAGAGGVTDIVEHGVTGMLVKPDDSGELARSLDRLAKDPELRRAIADRGYAHAKAKFSMASTLENLKAVIADVAAGH